MTHKAFAFFFITFFPIFSLAGSFPPTLSEKEIEVTLSEALKERLDINATLRVNDNKGEDLRVVTLFGKDENEKIPKIAAFIDTKLLNKDQSGNALSQIISIFSTAEVEVKKDDRLKLLEWANAWNSNALPIRIQIVNETIMAAMNLVTTKNNPITEEVVLSSYLSVVKIWPAIIRSLEEENLISNNF